ncbi:unnamed protein product [Clonostachys byssicola]|uniref:Uncharacterized protein n=1 Tax=Clonostachys byssicola TaxID=160290 RepID=A0A9N9YBD1_9HYPO|nr:unnamed protein product [Clonostachys byssicola]
MAESPVKTEGDAAPRPKAGYKSWKKKYRKMRISFENKMHEGEDIFKQEAKAQATVKRLAIENDRLLDILLEINNSPQIPLEKRVNISLPPSKSSDRIHPIDQDYESQKELPLKRLEDLIHDVPHQPYRLAKESDPHLVAELEKSEGDNYPAHFLCADDIDNYLHLIDQNMEPDNPVPTLAPLAHPTTNPPLHPLLKNPNSATSWLRRHAPHIFLQGIQEPGAEPHEDASAAGGADDAASTHTPSHAGGRKSRGGARGERGGKTPRVPKGTKRSRASLAAAAAAAADVDVSMDDDGELNTSTPVANAKGSKRKRVTEDDQGYRPKGTTSRPTKKKRKSEGGAEGTPTVRKSKSREALAASAEAD